MWISSDWGVFLLTLTLQYWGCYWKGLVGYSRAVLDYGGGVKER